MKKIITTILSCLMLLTLIGTNTVFAGGPNRHGFDDVNSSYLIDDNNSLIFTFSKDISSEIKEIWFEGNYILYKFKDFEIENNKLTITEDFLKSKGVPSDTYSIDIYYGSLSDTIYIDQYDLINGATYVEPSAYYFNANGDFVIEINNKDYIESINKITLNSEYSFNNDVLDKKEDMIIIKESILKQNEYIEFGIENFCIYCEDGSGFSSYESPYFSDGTIMPSENSFVIKQSENGDIEVKAIGESAYKILDDLISVKENHNINNSIYMTCGLNDNSLKSKFIYNTSIDGNDGDTIDLYPEDKKIVIDSSVLNDIDYVNINLSIPLKKYNTWENGVELYNAESKYYPSFDAFQDNSSNNNIFIRCSEPSYITDNKIISFEFLDENETGLGMIADVQNNHEKYIDNDLLVFSYADNKDLFSSDDGLLTKAKFIKIKYLDDDKEYEYITWIKITKFKDAFSFSVKQSNDLSIYLNDLNEDLYKKIKNKEYKIIYGSNDAENEIDYNFLKFDDVSNTITILQSLHIYNNSLKFKILDDEKVISSSSISNLKDLNWDNRYETIIGKNSEDALAIISHYETKEKAKTIDKDNIASFTVKTRTVNVGFSDTMQTYHSYVLSDIEKYGIDLSNSIPIREYLGFEITYNDGSTEERDQFTYNIDLTNGITSSFSLPLYAGYRIGIDKTSDLSNVKMKVAYEGKIYDVPMTIKYNDETSHFDITFTNDKFPGDLVLYNDEKNILKETRTLTKPVIYSYVDDYDNLKAFAKEQLTNGWSLVDEDGELEQKYYLNYKGDNYLLAVVNKGTDKQTDIYELIETTPITDPELKAIQQQNGDVVITYKNPDKINKYNDILTIKANNASCEIGDYEKINGVVYKPNSIKVDLTNKTWTIPFEYLCSEDFTAGETYLFSIVIDKDTSYNADLTINKVDKSTVINQLTYADDSFVAKLNNHGIYDNNGNKLDLTKFDSISITRYPNYLGLAEEYGDAKVISSLKEKYGFEESSTLIFDTDLIIKCHKGSNVTFVKDGYDCEGIYIPVEISVSTLQAKAIGIDNLSNRTLKIIRNHNGTYSEIQGIVSPVYVSGAIESYTVKFESDKFSTFAISTVANVTNGGESNNDNQVYKAPNTKVKAVPNTGIK